jgi:hypothetical protein
VGVVALRSVERRYDCRTAAASNKIVAISRVPAAQDVPAEYHEG